jgi:hypothetical protein
MANITLHEFIGGNRAELIRRCKAKVAKRSSPAQTAATLEHGVPIFLDQLVAELRDGWSKSPAIKESAAKHGSDLLRHGFTVSQVVHDYGDVCQAVTDLAVESNAPIGTDDFRTLNRCLDDAIAGAVTQHAAEREDSRDGKSSELRNLLNTAIAAFEVLQTGSVAVGGSTGGVVHRSLLQLRTVMDRPGGGIAPPDVTEHATVRTNAKRKR